jgi:hypothetical protein
MDVRGQSRAIRLDDSGAAVEETFLQADRRVVASLEANCKEPAKRGPTTDEPGLGVA